MKILDLSIQGIGPYQDKATFKFKPGISVIYGLNHTSGKNSKNSNWVGKSLLFSTLSEVLYEQPIIGSKQDRITKGYQELTLSVNNKTYAISKKNNKYSIAIDGVKQDFVTNKKGPKELIESIWPLSIEEYETLVHIDSRVPHPLVMGSTAVRKDFFTKFFGLDKVDAERKLYLAELNKLSTVKESYSTLLSTYNLIKKDALSENSIIDLRKTLEKMKTTLESMKSTMLEMKKKRQVLDFAETWKAQLGRLSSEGNVTASSLDLAKSDWKKKVDVLVKQKAEAERYKLYLMSITAYTSAYNNLSDKEKAIPFKKAQIGHERYVNAKLEADKYSALLSRYKYVLTAAVSKPEETDLDIGAIESDLAIVKHQIEHVEKFKNGVCPTCGQPVQNVDLAELKSKFASLKNQKNKYEKYIKQLESYKKYEEDKSTYDEASDSINKLNTIIEKYRKYDKLYKKLILLPEKPEAFNGHHYDYDVVSKNLETAKSNYEFYSHISTFANRVEEYFKLEDKSIDDSIFEKYTKYSNKYYAEKTKLENAEATLEKLEKIKSQLYEMKEKLKDEKPLEYLVELFQDKSLKKRIVQIIGNRLMSVVNKYAAVVFNEDYKFSLEWESSQINLLCTRKAGKTELVSDVRKLSGAESRLFTVILILSLLSFVPTEKRPNVIILDELDSNMAVETAESFYKLLKVLQNAIESIVLITVRDNIYPDTMCYTIVRDGTSKIVEGHPNELK